MAVILDGNQLTLHDYMRVVRDKEQVKISDEAIARIHRSRRIIDTIVANEETVYGVNTGFGELSKVAISNGQLSTLQENLLKSHACGVGPYFNEEVTRGMMVLRVNALIKGYSGIRLETIRCLLDMLNHDILPLIPEQGSLGASGDLAPLAHMALPIIGLGDVRYRGQKMPAGEAFKQANLKPLSHLDAKEGLSLINGTQAMTALGAIVLYDAINLLKTADLTASLSMEALLAIRDAFEEEVHRVRGQLGQVLSARNIRMLTEESEYLTRQGERRVQDAYSLRCTPQVHGATRDALAYVKEKVEIEMNAVTDNPIVIDRNRIISGGNFHGQPMALAFDFMKMAIAELANISERRLERLVNPMLSDGLPPFLAENAGVNSGFMIVQYAAASLVSENKVLAHPASVDSIPSSANQEDHVSMGTISARGARDILENTKKVIAMELITACQGIDFRAIKRLGRGTQVAYERVRERIPFIRHDVIMAPLIDRAIDLIEKGRLIHDVERKIGPLYGVGIERQ